MRYDVRFPAFVGLLLSLACATPRPDTPVPLQRVPVSGGELEYRVSGRGEPVLLIHGAIFATALAPLLTQPALADYRLIYYHRRGFAGSSRAPSPFTIPEQAVDAVTLLDRLGIQRAHVVGHSYGGAIALELANRYPDRVASLVLLEPALFNPTEALQKLFAAVADAGALYARGDRRSAISSFSNTVGGPGTWESLSAAGLTAMQEQAITDAPTFFEVELPAMQQWQFSFPDVARLRVPILAVVGANSNVIFRETHDALRHAVPSAAELVVPGAAHELQMSQPRFVAEGIAAFLRRPRFR